MNEFHEVYGFLVELENMSSDNGKESILNRALDNPTFVKTVQYALSQGWTYNISELELSSSPEVNVTAETVFNFLDYMRERGGATVAEKRRLSDIASYSEETFIVVSRIISKDLRCGIGAKTINNIRPETCFEVPYQRCSSESKIAKIKYPALIEKKADSMFSYSRVAREIGKFLTRGGIYFDVPNKLLIDELRGFCAGDDLVTVGELQVLSRLNGKVLSRKIGNGILNSIIQGTATQEQIDRVVYDIWDVIPYENFIQRHYNVNIIHRFQDVLRRIQFVEGYVIDAIPHKFVSSEKEAREFYSLMRSKGFEGAILKNFNGYWKVNESTDQVKLKNRSTAEFIIIDAYYGKKGKKNAHILGGITVKSSCGGIISNCGGGFSDKERELGVDWWKEQIGKIVSIEYESVIDDKTARNTKKLYSPGFVEIRHDKNEADTMAYCIEISSVKQPE